MIVKYYCELCGEEFLDHGEALSHEFHDEVHVRPNVYRVKPLKYLPPKSAHSGNDPRPYPVDVAIPMADGALVQYTFKRVITPPPPEKPAAEE